MLASCAKPPQTAPRYAVLPFDNLTGEASFNWVASVGPRIVVSELGGMARAAASINDAYLENANRFVHGYFTKAGNQLRLTVEIEDSATHKMAAPQKIDGNVLDSANALAKELDPKAAPFSTSNEEAVAAWGRGEFEKAVTLDPEFGTAWLGWIETTARTGDTPGAIALAGRAMEHPVKSETDGLRIQLVRATLENDPRAENNALMKLTAKVDDPALLANLGELAMKTRDFALAAVDYQKIEILNPNEADAANKLGYALGFDGRIDEARVAFERYGKSPGQEPNSFDSLGEVYFVNGKFADAEKAFLRAHELNPALIAGGDLRKAAYAHWLAGDLAGADKIFARYLEFRAKLKDPAVVWEQASWEYATGRADQAIARLSKTPTPQAAVEIKVWRGEVKLPSDADQLKRAYDATDPSADGLFRTLYASALAASGNKDEAKKLAARWPLPDSAGDPVLQSLLFPKYLALRRMLGL